MSPRIGESTPIPRCCQSHDDWPTLGRHLADAFPRLNVSDIARELRVAREAITTVDVGDEALEMAELIARHRLMVAAGQIGDAAKLDPQPHARKRSTAMVQ